jgi:Fe-S oxidoreductase/nitrate reductase gamma subunit
MKPTREIFWNIQYGWLVYPVSAVAMIIFAYGLYKRYQLWMLGKKSVGDAKASRWPKIDAVRFLWHTVGHERILAKFYPGFLHFLLFFGFAVLMAGAAIDGFQKNFAMPFLHWHFMEGPFYLWYSLTTDMLGIFAVIAVVMALARRLLWRPKTLENRSDDFVTLIWIGLILVSGFVVEGLRVSVMELKQVPQWAQWSPGGYAFALMFDRIGMTEAVARNTHVQLWWIHMFISVGFIAYMPFSKLLHIFTAPLNILLEKPHPGKALPLIDFEKTEQFGATQITDFTRKQLLDLDACTRCGRCDEHCPACVSEKPYSVRKLIQDMKSNLEEVGANLKVVKPATPAKDGEQPQGGKPARKLLGDVIKPDDLWWCTSCGSCKEHCPSLIGCVDKNVEFRRNLVMAEEPPNFPPEVKTVFKSMETNGNPWSFSWQDRAKWAAGLDVKVLGDGVKAEYVYYVGCSGAFDERSQKVAVAVVKILKAAGVDFAILGANERCCGDSARRIGNEYLYQTLAQHNIEAFNQVGAKKVITTCPHGYNTIKNEYPQMGGNYEVVHHSELIARLIKDGKLKLTKPLAKRVIYHDSCYLGRYNDIYHPPRDVVSAIPGVSAIEFPRSGPDSFCCGAGGGRMWMEEKAGKRINQLRTQEAVDAKADVIATGCPFCLTMLFDGIKELNQTEKMKAMDIAELVAEAL